VTALYEGDAATTESGFAGVAYEGSGVTLYYKGALTPEMKAAVAKARAVGPIAVKAAAFSEAELQRASDKITDRSISVGGVIQSVELETDGSGLTVESVPTAVVAAAAAKRSAKKLKPLVSARDVVSAAKVDVPVRFTTGTEQLKLMASRTDDFSPWNGGGRWSSYRGDDVRGTCTLGFGTKNNAGERFVLTAAHCGTPPDQAAQGIPGSSFQHMGPVYQQSVSADLLIIRANGSSLIFDGTSTTSNTRLVTGWAYWAKNQLVCQSGMVSGTICGLRQQSSGNQTMGCCDSDGDQGYTIQGLIKTTKDGGGTAVRTGDSGGPVFTYNGANVTAKGITSLGGGSTMYFQDWADVGRIWGLSPY